MDAGYDQVSTIPTLSILDHSLRPLLLTIAIVLKIYQSKFHHDRTRTAPVTEHLRSPQLPARGRVAR
jgi:hypothetical protein